MAAKILTIAQQKGGAGKTTLAAQLAVTWMRAGLRVACLDIDPQASLATWFDFRERFAKEDDPLSIFQLAGWRVSTELGRLRREFDIIVIDSPPHAETEAKIAVRAADLVLIPIQPSPMDAWATAETTTLARDEKTPILAVMNRVPARGRVVERVRAMLAEQKLNTAQTTLGNRVAFADSMMEGHGVVESHRRSPAADEIRALAAEVGPLLGLSA